MNIHTLFPSKYLKAHDLQGRRVNVTIAALKLERMGRDNEQKPVLYFQSAGKGLILGKVTAMQIARLHGDETDNWTGKRITLYATTVQAFGEQHDVVRVADTVPPSPPPPQPLPTDTAPIARPQQAHEDEHGDLVYAAPPVHDEVSFDDIPGAQEQRSNGSIPAWRGPVDAQCWAIDTGACANEHEARNSWKKIVVALGGLNAENAPEVYRQFYARQQEKLTAKQAA